MAEPESPLSVEYRVTREALLAQQQLMAPLAQREARVVRVLMVLMIGLLCLMGVLYSIHAQKLSIPPFSF